MGKGSNYSQARQKETSRAEEIQNKIQEKKSVIELENKKKDFKNSLKNLENKMYEFDERYGEEDYRTQLIIGLYDVCLEMNDAIDLMEGTMTALQCINQTIGFMNECLNYNQIVQEQSLQQKYGLIYRIKSYFRRKRVIRNMEYRFMALSQSIDDIVNISNTMVESLRKSMIKMRARMDKKQAKRAKQMEKKGVANPTFSRSRAIDILHQKHGNDTNVNNIPKEDDAETTAPQSSSSSSDSPNLGGVV